MAISAVDGETVRCADIYLYGEGTVPLSGSRIEARGECFSTTPYANANAFDYSEYLRQQGIAAQFSTYYGGTVAVLTPGYALSFANFGAFLRSCFDQAATVLNETQRTLVYGVFLGEKSGLDFSLKQDLSLSGMMHLFAVSGLHVGYLVFLALLLAGKGFSRRKARFWLTLLLLLLYLSLTGAAPSILRASIMALLFLLAGLFMEEVDAISTLSLAALLCLLLHPLWLFNAGFLLSFAAMWGILVLTPFFRRLFGGREGFITSSLVIACAATLAVLPLVCFYFYHVTWLSWLLSPLVLPAAGLAVILCFLALLLSLFFPLLAGFLLQAAAFIMELLAAAAKALSTLPFFAAVTGAPSYWAVLLCYACLLLLPWFLRRFGRWRSAIYLLLLVVVLFSFSTKLDSPWRTEALPEVLVTAVFLDVGQGDAILFRTQDGKTVLVDGGGKASSPGSIGEYVLLPYLKSVGVDKIDLLISSHPDIDHSDGLVTVLEEMDVGAFLFGVAFGEEEEQKALLAAAKSNGCVLIAAGAGYACSLGDYLQIRVYGPVAGEAYEDENAASVVIELSCGAVDFLLTGDADGETLRLMAEQNHIEAEILKLPHHGSATGYDEAFYQIVDPEAVVVSVGRENSYGHPGANVIEYWQARAEIYRTDLMGAVTIWSDGKSWVAQTEN